MGNGLAFPPPRAITASKYLADRQTKGGMIVSDMNLISITAEATEAFANFDWSEHEGKSVRLFVQGFG
ncbi:hypothetical protein CSB20_07505 [bacterium DOLZORAL124_64_63]|nr:MAG: hypothetical protein CSB20_07505 [bacterium DOLZORAL124_64_63]